MNKSDIATLLGAGTGTIAGGLLGYLGTNKKKSLKTKIRNAALLALTGGLSGGYLGRVGNAYNDFLRRKAIARMIPAGEKAVPGDVYYVDHPDNSIDVSKTSIPWVDKLADKLKKLLKWDGKMHIGHSGVVTVDQNGNASRYDYGMYANDPSTMGKGGFLPVEKFSVKGMSKEEIAKLLQSKAKAWGGTVNMYGQHVDDIGVIPRYINTLKDKDTDSFSIIPGGYSCSTVARNLVDADSGSVLSPIRDLLWGGFPSSNAPTHGTTSTHYSNEE